MVPASRLTDGVHWEQLFLLLDISPGLVGKWAVSLGPLRRGDY